MRGDHELQKRVLSDLCSGMDDTGLMEKYSISYSELRNLYKDLFDTGMLAPARIDALAQQIGKASDRTGSKLQNSARQEDRCRVSLSHPIITPARDRRREGRYDTTTIQVPVYDRDRPEIHGLLREINETGARLAGVEAQVGDVRTIVALGDMSGEVAPFEFQARCCWTETPQEDGPRVTGFEITDISDENLHELRKLIDASAWGG